MREGDRKSILADFVSATPREKISIVSDFMSIAGVSIAAIAGGALSLGGDLYVENVIGVIAVFLFSAAVAAILLIGCIALLRLIAAVNDKTYRAFLLVAFWCLSAMGIVLASLLAYQFLGSIPFVRQQTDGS